MSCLERLGNILQDFVNSWNPAAGFDAFGARGDVRVLKREDISSFRKFRQARQMFAAPALLCHPQYCGFCPGGKPVHKNRAQGRKRP
jgi:hypothetical protein